jgi:ABC-type multidrug transport system permease subunit
LCLFALLGSGIGLLIGATVLDVKKALTASIIIVLGSVLLGGFFIAQENLRVWIRWARWTSFMKYTYELMLLNEFDLGDQNYTPSTPSTFSSNPITGNDILNRLNVETEIWADVRFSSLSLFTYVPQLTQLACRSFSLSE